MSVYAPERDGRINNPPCGRTAPTSESLAEAAFSEPHAILTRPPLEMTAGFAEIMHEGRRRPFSERWRVVSSFEESFSKVSPGTLAPTEATEADIPLSTSLSSKGNTVTMPVNTVSAATPKTSTRNIRKWYTRRRDTRYPVCGFLPKKPVDRVYLTVNGPESKNHLPKYSAWMEF